MKIDDLKLFIRIVELGSFTAAANALELPRANVSRRISELESTLNVQLFFRTTRKISLTQHGEAYYSELLKALEALEKANQIAIDSTVSPKGVIKIGLLPESDETLQPLLLSFQDKYQDIELDIRSINNGFIDLQQQGLDVAIHGGKIHDANIVARKVLELERHLVASPEYLTKYGSPTDLPDVMNHQTICFRWPGGELDNRWQIAEHELVVKSKLSSNNIGFVKRSVILGRGIGFLPTILISKELEDGSLMKILPGYKSETEDVWLLYPQRKTISHATHLLIDFFLDEMPKLV
ncbi:LysR family transcriptional regulator [Vibrio cortegadensis]|uniref:LysR family transcriptional regulator n=1 Tax=Vibrio cortegadensis TaxID=1328770 RepID=A0ABV4M2R4_9VIBR